MGHDHVGQHMGCRVLKKKRERVTQNIGRNNGWKLLRVDRTYESKYLRS